MEQGDVMLLARVGNAEFSQCRAVTTSLDGLADLAETFGMNSHGQRKLAFKHVDSRSQDSAPGLMQGEGVLGQIAVFRQILHHSVIVFLQANEGGVSGTVRVEPDPVIYVIFHSCSSMLIIPS
jgi:hypothetical protein